MIKENIDDLIWGIILIIFSIITYLGSNILYKHIVNIIYFILFLRSLFQILKSLLTKQNQNQLPLYIFNLTISLIFLLVPKLSLLVIPLLFSLYLFILGTAQFIMYILFIEYKVPGKINYLIWTIIYYSISIPMLCKPTDSINNFLFWVEIYIFLLGLSSIENYLYHLIIPKNKDNLKRKIKLTLPAILEAIIPYSVMKKINNSLEVAEDYQKINTTNKQVDMYIFIHTSNKGVNKFGHIDLYFDGKVISYGNYDEGTWKVQKLFGDGVIFTTSKKEEYINFCIENSKKTIFEFGITLNNNQKIMIRQKIKDIMSNTVKWNYKEDKRYHDGKSYAARLYKYTKAQFYKFKNGKYKTYFVLGSNCCYLADDIIGKSGIDMLSISGIMTPGTYYDYLDRLLHKQNSIVISKSIYISKIKQK